MAIQSKLLSPDRSIRKSLTALTQLYLRHRTKVSRAVYLAFFVALVHRIRHAISEQKAASLHKAEARKAASAAAGSGPDPDAAKPTRRPRIELNRAFLHNLARLLRIVIPGWRSVEFRLLVSHSVFLVARTLISLHVADLDGRLVSSLVRGRARAFGLGLVWWMLVAVPATFTNSVLEYHQSQLALRYRARLTHHIHEKYLDNMTFYGLTALDDRIRNADQLITVDTTRFANSLAELYANLAKPVLDLALYSWALARAVGGEGLLGMSLLVQLSALGLRALTPPFGRYVAEEARLEGAFRAGHARLLEHAEEVALLAGQEAEKDALDKGYFSLIKYINRVLRRRAAHAFLEDFVLKYFWGALGLLLCSVPVFFRVPGAAPKGMGERTESFVTSRRLLLSASDAFGRLMFSYKEVSELAGHAHRVATLLVVMDDVAAGRFEKKLVSSSRVAQSLAPTELLRQRGTVTEGPDIDFAGVPVISPNADVLVPALTFHVRPGAHLLIVGPNGCGKSSLFRILGGLWPVCGGAVRKPPPDAIFYIPQRPYLSRGSLRQQLVYPDDAAAVRARGVSDAELLTHLEAVDMGGVVERAGGWDATAEWRDVLSGGLQQRLAMARLFYHAPKYAILDECTSGVPVEVERSMYERAKALGITLMTVSHRRSLWKYHENILQFDGQGGYVFTKLDAEKRLRLEDEKEELELQLRTVPEIERRIKELTS